MVYVEKSNTTVTKKEKIEDIGMKLEHLLSEDITFYEFSSLRNLFK